MGDARVITAFIVATALCIGLGSYAFYGKIHNPVEEKMEDIIEQQTGINLDDYLPPDAPDSATSYTEKQNK